MSDASRIAEHGPKKKKEEPEKSRGKRKKEKAFCNVMRHKRIQKKKMRMTSKKLTVK